MSLKAKNIENKRSKVYADGNPVTAGGRSQMDNYTNEI